MTADGFTVSMVSEEGCAGFWCATVFHSRWRIKGSMKKVCCWCVNGGRAVESEVERGVGATEASGYPRRAACTLLRNFFCGQVNLSHCPIPGSPHLDAPHHSSWFPRSRKPSPNLVLKPRTSMRSPRISGATPLHLRLDSGMCSVKSRTSSSSSAIPIP